MKKTNNTELTLSGMKAQLNSKKRPLKVAKKKAPVKVSTDVKAKPKKEDKPKAVKIPFDVSEQDIATALNLKLKETTIKEKLRRVATKDNIQLVSMPERKQINLKINNKVVCEIYPKSYTGEFAFCTKEKYIDGIKLKNITVTHHEKWDMTEAFTVNKSQLSGILSQFIRA